MLKSLAEFGKPFWIFLFSENLYDCGLYVFVLLYNLYLLDLGYREDFLGWVTSAMTAGSIAGALPAAWVTRRFGLKRSLIFASAGIACLCAIRVLIAGRPALLASAFTAGLLSATWVVSLVPVVAALTKERDRPLGYSLWTGWGVGLGILCGPLAGALPGWMLRTGSAAGFSLSNAGAKRASLLLGAMVAFFAPWLLVRLPLVKPERTEPKTFPRGPFITRYLAAASVWNFAAGIFNPFFTAYFSRQLHMPVGRIGAVFSASQLATLGALAIAPSVLRKLGPVRGIAGMQLGMAASLALLAAGPPALVAAALYAAYMAFQVMTEPGIFTLLMGGVDPGERAGASALNSLAMSAPQAAAAGLAGMAVTYLGYRVVLASAAAMAALAAFLFLRLLAEGHVNTPAAPRVLPSNP